MNSAFPLSVVSGGLAALNAAADAEEQESLSKSSVQRSIAYMLAKGDSPETIAFATGLTIDRIKAYMRHEATKAMVRQIIQDDKDIDPRMMLRSFLSSAIQALGDIVSNLAAKPQDRISAAKEILSRNLGNIALGAESKQTKDPVQEYAELSRKLQPTR